MAKILAEIEIVIEQQGGPAATVKASLQFEGTASYKITISKPVGQIETTALDCDSQGPAAAWMVQRLKQLVDEFSPNTSTIRVVTDTLNLLPKISYRCSNPQCKTKLFESWGPALGIRIICRKCKTLGVPAPDRHSI